MAAEPAAWLGDRAGLAAARRRSQASAAAWREGEAHRDLTARFDAVAPGDAEGAAGVAEMLLADTAWLAALLAPLTATLAGDPLYEPPLRVHRDLARIGAILFEHGAVSITATTHAAAALERASEPERVIVPGRLAVVRYHRAGGARWRGWRAEPVGASFTAAAAAPCRPLPDLALSDGMVVRHDGRVLGGMLAGAGGDVTTLTATIRYAAAPLMREYALPEGRLARVATLDDSGSRGAMLLTLLRLSGRHDAGECFAAASRSPAFHWRWGAMREWLALDLAAALPRLRDGGERPPRRGARGGAREAGGRRGAAEPAARRLMPLVLDPGSGEAIEVDELVDILETTPFDPRDEASFAALGPALARLGRNRGFLADLAIDELKGRCVRQAALSGYSAQALLLRPANERYVLRAAFWPARDDAVVRASGAAPFAYDMAHDHNFSFLTYGYLGPGYWSDYYLFGGADDALPGDPAHLSFAERSRLEPEKLMLYRAHRDVHVQLPPDAFSVSLNIMAYDPAQPWRSQYRFDIGRDTIAEALTVTASEALVALAAQFGGDNGLDLAHHLVRRHPSARMRRTALNALAAREADAVGRASVYSLAADDAPLAAHARRKLDLIESGA